MNKNIQLVKQMGLRWTIYRFQYELKKKIGYLERAYPQRELEDIKDIDNIDISIIRNSIKSNLSMLNSNYQLNKDDLTILLQRIDRLFKGEFRYFFNEYHEFKAWNYSPKTKHYAPNNIHWSKISEFGNDFGDIKWIWDLNRFHFSYDLTRAYVYTKDERYAEKFWELFEDFNEHNPLEIGPNYRCSQEMSFRANAWLFSLYFLLNSVHSTDERIIKMVKLFSHYLKHIKHHLNFSVEAVKNNHSISESVMLIVFGKTLDFLPNSETYIKIGENTLRKELNWQIKKDGSFIQNSHNYHRLVLQNLSWAILTYRSKNEDIPNFLREKANASIKFFMSFISEEGFVPNYGMNDGSYIFPLTERDYLDYRPVLQNINYQINKKLLFKDKDINEIAHIFNKNLVTNQLEESNTNFSVVTNKEGGYIVSKVADFTTILKSKTYKERPNQADNHHLDIWYKGKNIFKDAGTYSYNDTDTVLNYFNGTASHNTIMLNDENQMIKGSRFIWYNWSKTSKAIIKKSKNLISVKSKLLNYGEFQHERRVITSEKSVIIKDKVLNNTKEILDFKLQWLTEKKVELVDNKLILKDENLEIRFESEHDLVIEVYRGSKEPYRGWVSETYGEIHPANQIVIHGKSNKKITRINTQIDILR